MIVYLVPIVLAALLTWISNYATLTLPPPYSYTSVVHNPELGKVGPLIGPLERNTILGDGENLFRDQVIGPETVTFDDQGRMYLFTEKGIYRALPKGEGFDHLKMFLEISGGRPLSGAFDPNGTLYFCDSILGLYKMNIDTRKYEMLLGADILFFCDDLDISSDGIVYFVDASKTIRPPKPSQVVRASVHAIASGLSDGRLLKYSPSTGSLETLIDDISFANGVTLSHDERSILVSDGTPMFRIRRYWLEGPKKGSQEIFFDKLPGYGDGISRGSNGTYWVAVFTRVDRMQYALLRFRLTRWLTLLLPEKLTDAIVVRHGIILQVDEEGQVLRSFHDPENGHGRTTSATEQNGRLYVGSFNHFVKVVDLFNCHHPD